MTIRVKIDRILGGIPREEDVSISKWIASTAYAVDDLVWLSTNNGIYRCVTANNDLTFDADKWTAIGTVGSYNLDGGAPDSVYGGIPALDGGEI